MANIQRYLETFHDQIKLGRFKEEQTLREKRDIIIDKLKERLPEVFAAHQEAYPAPEFADQGSYDMRTGTKPLDGDYDIDQGVYFPVAVEDYPDPVILKLRVWEALDGHTNEVRVREPCVTVFYQLDGDPIYHVDLAIYSDGAQHPDGKPRLARGKEHSAAENRRWEASDPQGLVTTIEGRFTGSDLDQFRRVVRYLKRWKDLNFPKSGHAAPRGIALTVAAYNWMPPTYGYTFDRPPDDLGALRSLVRGMLGRFVEQWHAQESSSGRRLAVTLPVTPCSDLFAKMTNLQMAQFEAKLLDLQAALDAAGDAVDPVVACETLQGVFGQEFPVPAKEETAKRHSPAIVSSSSSA